MNQVELRFFPKSRRVALRELNGFDEQSIGGTHTLAAIGLLDRLLVANPAYPLGPEKSAGFTASDRDRLLAAVYARSFGSRIESTARCRQCGQLFDLDFPLDQLLAHLESQPSREIESQPDARFRMPDGCIFRLPTGEDECAVAGLPLPEAEAALWARCVLEPGTHSDASALLRALDEVDRALDVDLNAVCPECSHSQTVHFNMQTYLLTILRQEQNALIGDVHRLATAYGWSLHEILGMTRSQRHAFVNLIEAEPR